MTPEVQEALAALQKQLGELYELFVSHRHKGYDQTEKLRLSDLGMYIVALNEDGTAASIPDGWTSSKPATGHYTITHNLNTTDYKVFAICNAATFATTQTSGNSATAAEIYVFNTSGTQVDKAIYVLLVKDPN